MNPNKKRFAMGYACVLAAALAILPASAHAITIGGLKANTDSVGRYEPYELTFSLAGVSPADYNPFRPETTGDSLSAPGVDVRAEVITPSGLVRTVWGFFDVDYVYLGNVTDPDHSKRDRMVPISGPHWHIRYALTELGIHRVTVMATDRTATATSAQLTFSCTESGNPGFIRVAEDGERLSHTDGTPFVPFGIQSPNGTGRTVSAVASMRANGLNFIRRWLVDRDTEDIYRNLEGWSTSGVYDTGVYRSGTRSVRKSVSSAGTLVDQSFIGCKPNTYYKAFAHLKTSSSFNGRAAVRVVEHRADGSKSTHTGHEVGAGRDWTKSEVVFKTSSSAEMIHFKPRILSGSSGTVWVDDVGLYQCDSSGNTVIDWNMVFSASFEEWTPEQLRTVPLARFEHLLRICEENAIVVQPVIFNYRLWHSSNPTGFYAKYFGDFFTDPESIAQQRRVLRYLVARFGSYTSLMAWELANEMDSTYTNARGAWIKGHAEFLHQNDPYGRMVTNSLWRSPGDVKYAQVPELDMNQVHYYINTEERVGGQGVPGWWNQPSGVAIDTKPSNAYSGSNSLKFTANGGTLSDSQTVYCLPSRSYTLKYEARLSGVTGSATVIVRVYDVNGSELAAPVNSSDTGTSGYAARQQTFTTGAAAAYFTVELKLTGSYGTAWFDDVQAIHNVSNRNILYNGGFESPNFGDDEFEWAVYNTFRSRAAYESGPGATTKPWASGEFGLMGANADLSYWARYGDTTKPRHDSTGIHLHNCVWAQLMASSALNTPTYWWVDEYVLRYSLFDVWQGATTFASELPFYHRGESVSTPPYPADTSVQSSNSRIRVLGQKTSDAAYLWIQNGQHTWSRVVRDGLNPGPADSDITIPGFASGTYTIDWYDTYASGISRTEIKSVTSGLLTLSVSSLAKDTAVIIKRQSATTSQPNVDLLLTPDKATAIPSEVITYTIVYTNTGAAEAVNVKIRLPIPPNTSYVAGSASSGGMYDSGSSCVRWTIPSLSPGASGQCTASVRVN